MLGPQQNEDISLKRILSIFILNLEWKCSSREAGMKGRSQAASGCGLPQRPWLEFCVRAASICPSSTGEHGTMSSASPEHCKNRSQQLQLRREKTPPPHNLPTVPSFHPSLPLISSKILWSPSLTRALHARSSSVVCSPILEDELHPPGRPMS